MELQLWTKAWVLKVWRRTSGVHSVRDQPRPGISQRTTGAGCPGRTGIPRARGFHGRRASLRAPPPSQTPAACACGAELGGGRFPCASAVTSARGVFSRGFPSRSPAGFNPSCAGVKAGKSELGICSSRVEGTGLASPRGGRGGLYSWVLDERLPRPVGYRAIAGWWVPAIPKSAQEGTGGLRLQIPGSLRNYSATDSGREDEARGMIQDCAEDTRLAPSPTCQILEQRNILLLF